ncbi:hypothetical protein MferCBS49748_001212 [Microsporum ferrugineum]
MRWGFDPKPNYGRTPDRRPQQTNNRPPKRQHEAAFTSAPLPVPSFNSLPSKPPAPAQTPPARPRKQRKHNQLGLTPKTEEHESSESEAGDVDEEAKLAASLAKGELKFSYKGRTSTLGSTAEVRAWIEERKRRFPTRERVEEKTKEEQARKAAKEEARKQKDEARRRKEEEARKQREEEARKAREKREKEKRADASDVAAKAKMRADKLREKLARQERKLAQAEAAAAREEQAQAQAQARGTWKNNMHEDSAEQQQDEAGATMTLTPAQSDQTSSADDDSGSESESSGSDSDSDIASGSGSEPEETTSRRQQPDRVPPRRRCHQFAKTGQCRRGSSCPFSHDTPARSEMNERAQRQNPRASKGEKAGRKGLYERLLLGQREDEDRRVMQAIVFLGERRLLDNPVPVDPANGVL